MGLEDQAAVKRVADEHGSGVVVLLGTPDAESTQTLAQTVVAGDPSYAGPLAGVPLGLPVFHVFEPEVRDQVPGDVYEAQAALMEMSLDRDAILNGLARGAEGRRHDVMMGGVSSRPLITCALYDPWTPFAASCRGDTKRAHPHTRFRPPSRGREAERRETALLRSTAGTSERRR